LKIHTINFFLKLNYILTYNSIYYFIVELSFCLQQQHLLQQHLKHLKQLINGQVITSYINPKQHIPEFLQVFFAQLSSSVIIQYTNINIFNYFSNTFIFHLLIKQCQKCPG
jgi:hypothetical protein